MSIEEIRGRVVSFAKEYYKNYNVAPPIAVICKQIGISSRKKLYQIFPKGEREICEKAGIPVPFERISRRVKKDPTIEEKTAGTEGSPPLGFQLTTRQIERLYGLLHLEKHKSIKEIIDVWLDMDVELRLKHGLESTAEIARAVKMAKEIEEAAVDVKELVGNYWLFKQAGVPFTPNQLKTLASFLQELIDAGWSPSEIPNYVTALWLCDVAKFTQEDMHSLLELFDSARKDGKSVSEFIKEVNAEREKRESLKKEVEKLTGEVDGLRRKKESEIMELRNLEEAKRKIIKEINEARPWDKKEVMEMLKALSVASYSSEKRSHF
jgi:hypothetical protein